MTNGEISLDKPLEPKWLFYVLSFFIWPAGIILGILYMRKPDPDCKSFGKMCLILGIIELVVIIICVCLAVIAPATVAGCAGCGTVLSGA